MLGQLSFYPGDLLRLCANNLFRQCSHLRVLAVLEHDFRHSNGAFVVGDHSRHKIYVGVTGENNAHALVHGFIAFAKGFRGRGMLRCLFNHKILVVLVPAVNTRSVCWNDDHC